MLQNRSKKLLSGEDVINFKNNSLKDIPSGCKEYAPNDSWLENKQIQVTLETYHDLVGSERIEKKTSLLSAIWMPDVGKAKVTKRAGKFWEVFGHTVDSEDWLLPEEALFLLETNALELFRNDVPLSVEETYSLIIGDHCSLEEYQVYSHLSRKGYRVLRHDKEITSTAYEKEIHLDQINLVEKRSVPSTGVASKVDSNSGNESRVENTGDDVEMEIATEDLTKDKTDSAAHNPQEGVIEGAVQEEDSSNCSDGSASENQGKRNDGAAGNAKNSTPPAVVVDILLTDTTDDLNKDKIDTAAENSHDNVIEGAVLVEDSSDSSDGSSFENQGKENDGAAGNTKISTPPAVVVDISPAGKTEDLSRDKTVSASNNPQDDVIEGAVLVEDSSDSSAAENQGKENDGAAGNTKVSTPPAVVVDIPPAGTDDKEISSDVEMQDESKSFQNDLLSVSDSASLKKRVGSSPDLYIVEDEEEVIEIDDDDNEDESHEVEITEVKSSSHMDTVDLMDSEEDDDVVFICQKSVSKDPSQWRKWWFSTLPEFLSTEFPEENESKPTKLKLIDLFDLRNKSIDTIMKAIPRHDGSAGFINAPDLRFIPPNIVPKFAQYRINVQTYDGVADHEDESSIHSNSFGNVDTSQSLDQVVQYGHEPRNFSRNPYGYSFHRTRVNNYRRNNCNYNGQNGRYNNREGFNHHSEGFNSHNEGFNRHNEGFNRHNEGFNRHSEGFNNQVVPFNNFAQHSNMNQNFHRPNMNHNNFDMGQHNNGGIQGQLKYALQQACQMQILAMSLMQNSQALIQNCSNGPNMFNNPMVNLNTSNNFDVANNFNFPNNFNVGNQMNQFNRDFRGRRPYRRHYMRRGAGGRRRYFGYDRNSPKTTSVAEVVCIDSDEEECKVKQNPVYKRILALGAIADLNSPKRRKVLEVTEVKPEKSADLRRSGSSRKELEVIEISSKSDSATSGNLIKTENKPASTSEGISSSSKVTAESSTDIVEIPDGNDQPVYIHDETTASSASSVAVVIESTNDAVSESSKVSEDVEIRELTEESQRGENTELTTVDEAVASNQTTSDDEVPVSWKTYKEGLTETTPPAKTSSCLFNNEGQRAGVHDVLKSLQIFDPIEEATKEHVKVSFDVYLPNQPFKKSVRLLPNYRVIVSGSSSFPSVYDLNYLKETYKDDVPFLYAVLYKDSVGLYIVRPVSLPTLVEHV